MKGSQQLRPAASSAGGARGGAAGRTGLSVGSVVSVQLRRAIALSPFRSETCTWIRSRRSCTSLPAKSLLWQVHSLLNPSHSKSGDGWEGSCIGQPAVDTCN